MQNGAAVEAAVDSCNLSVAGQIELAVASLPVVVGAAVMDVVAAVVVFV